MVETKMEQLTSGLLVFSRARWIALRLSVTTGDA